MSPALTPVVVRYSTASMAALGGAGTGEETPSWLSRYRTIVIFTLSLTTLKLCVKPFTNHHKKVRNEQFIRKK